jgi:hypothetical protein
LVRRPCDRAGPERPRQGAQAASDRIQGEPYDAQISKIRAVNDSFGEICGHCGDGADNKISDPAPGGGAGQSVHPLRAALRGRVSSPVFAGGRCPAISWAPGAKPAFSGPISAEKGVPETMCSFHRTFLGAAESGLLPAAPVHSSTQVSPATET